GLLRAGARGRPAVPPRRSPHRRGHRGHRRPLEHELMLIARVVGSVVSTQKNGKLEGAKLLLAQPLDLDGKDRGPAVIAIDAVDAGVGDRVLLVLDGKAAMLALDRGLAGVDAAIVGVVDAVDIPGEPARR